MEAAKEKIKVASVQASPVLPLDKDKTVEKACELIIQASKEKADLVVFPETFIPMYPNFSIDLDNANEWRENLVEITKHSVYADGDEINKIAGVAKDTDTHVVIGINERVKTSYANLYNSQVFMDNFGNILGTRRKLFPSNREKAFWDSGNGCDIQVHNTSIGKIGGLICYEHLQPLLKYAHMALGEQIHCASWPGWPSMKGARSNKHVIDASARQYALEGQCFVIIAGLYVPPASVPEGFFGNASWSFFGGSGIVGPDGDYIAGPVYDKEIIIYGELDMSDILMRKALIDTSGRDQRWDVLKLVWNKEKHSAFAYNDTFIKAEEIDCIESEKSEQEQDKRE
jgi:predicted amidohydrolase